MNIISWQANSRGLADRPGNNSCDKTKWSDAWRMMNDMDRVLVKMNSSQEIGVEYPLVQKGMRGQVHSAPFNIEFPKVSEKTSSDVSFCEEFMVSLRPWRFANVDLVGKWRC